MARIPIHKVHIADGFTDDCEELIHRCLQVDVFNYQVFCEIWKDMSFAVAFQGRPSSAETAELSEELVNIAKHYMVANPSNFEESVIGLFLVYALVSLQPFPGFACLRIVPEDLDVIQALEAEARRTRRLDVLYVLGSLLNKSSEYQAAWRERGMESSYRKYLTEPLTISHQGVRPKGVFYRQNEELDVIRELNVLGRKYSQAKAQVKSGNDRNLNYMDEDMATNLETSIKKIINGIIDYNAQDKDESSHGETSMQTVKDKAMKGIVNKMRHLTGIEERTKQKNSPEKKSKQEPVAQMKNSPKKVTRRKRKAPRRRIQQKKRPRREESSSGSEEDVILPSDDDDDPDDTDYEPTRSITKDKSQTNTPTVKLKTNKDLPVILFNPDQQEDSQPDPEIEGNLISMADVEKTEELCYEIEIVEQLDENGTGNDIVVDSKDINIPSLDKTDKTSEISKSKAEEHVFKAPKMMPLRKSSRRDHKKTNIRNKFKRMGMLPAANFEENKLK